jgi:hypothetical protein
VPGREVGEGEEVLGGGAQHLFHGGELPAEHGEDLPLVADHVGLGLGEDGADRGGDHLRRTLGTRARTLRTKRTRQRWIAAPGEDGLRGAAQAGVGVGDDQLHPRGRGP